MSKRDDITFQDMIDAVSDQRKPVPGDSICDTCKGVISPLHCRNCDPFTHNWWKAVGEGAGA